MVSIEWTLEAKMDFDSILGYLNNVSPQYAYSLYEKVQDAIYNLKKFPKIGRKIPEYSDESDKELFIQ